MKVWNINYIFIKYVNNINNANINSNNFNSTAASLNDIRNLKERLTLCLTKLKKLIK